MVSPPRPAGPAGGPDPVVAPPEAAGPDRPLRAAVRRFAANRAAVAGLVVFVLLVLFAFVGRRVWRYEYDDLTGAYSAPPSAAHPFGTDASSHDLFAQVLRGTARSIEIAMVVAVLSTAIGTVVGAVAGYCRGLVDGTLMRMVDVVLTLPLYAVAALLGHQVGSDAKGWIAIALVLALLLWAPVARVVRGVTLGLRELEFLEAARALGAGTRHVLLRHVLPNAAGPIIVNATLSVAVAILAETALSYVGFGIQPPDVSLGSLVSAAEAASATRAWLFYFPGLAIVALLLAVNLIGDGLRDAVAGRGERR